MALLGEDRVAGAPPLDSLDDQGFAGSIDFRHEIDRRDFCVDVEAGLVSLALKRARLFGEITSELE
jgi:hypothetical protein